MLQLATEFITSKKGKQSAIILGSAVAVMTGIYYYHQIKLTRMKIKDLENKELTK
jgi:hypothetical protein